MLTAMAGQDPELTADVELRNAVYQLQVYEAIAVAAGDAHGTLDAILGASDPDAARLVLRQRYGFTELQAVAVMDLQLRRVTAIDREKIELRRQELAARVMVLEAELGGS
jgi:DNA gyrase subunit A